MKSESVIRKADWAALMIGITLLACAALEARAGQYQENGAGARDARAVFSGTDVRAEGKLVPVLVEGQVNDAAASIDVKVAESARKAAEAGAAGGEGTKESEPGTAKQPNVVLKKKENITYRSKKCNDSHTKCSVPMVVEWEKKLDNGIEKVKVGVDSKKMNEGEAGKIQNKTSILVKVPQGGALNDSRGSHLVIEIHEAGGDGPTMIIVIHPDGVKDATRAAGR